MFQKLKLWYHFDAPDWVTQNPIIKRTVNATWWFKYRFVREHQYNIVRTELAPGYYDIDAIMEATLITLLRRYVEDELGGEDALRAHVEDLHDAADNPEPGREFESPMLNKLATADAAILEAYVWFVHERAGKFNEYHAAFDQRHALRKKYGMSLFTTTNAMQMSKIDAEQCTQLRHQYTELHDAIKRRDEQMYTVIFEGRKGLWT